MMKVGLYAVATVATVILVGFPWWWADRLNGELTTAKAELAAAQTATDNCASALQQANDATAAAEAKAKLMQSQAQPLIDSAAGQNGPAHPPSILGRRPRRRTFAVAEAAVFQVILPAAGGRYGLGQGVVDGA